MVGSPPPSTTLSRRLVGVFACLTAAFVLMGGRLVMLQIVQAPAYARLAADQRQREILFPARRGAIFDRNGEPLAISVDLKTVYADPALVKNPQRSAAKLSVVLGASRQELARRLRGTRPGSRFEFLARQVRPRLARQVEDLGLPGIFLRTEPKRYYPNARLASHVVGFADVDNHGVTGVEAQYERILEGRPGRMILEQDPQGRPLPQAELTYERPRPGRSLFLTIDKKLQYFTELTLARAARRYSAEAATAIVMRPETGEVLALANIPDFDPNEAGEFPPEAHRNRALTDVYEPGSAYKIVTASAALEEKVVSPRTTFVVPDEMQYSDRVFHDSHWHPTEQMTVREIIEQSSNIGTIKVGLELGGALLDRYVRKFGFGSETGLGFPGEVAGIVVDRSSWSGSTIATIPIGQGIAVTAMQMAAAYATLANDGVWVEPKLVSATVSSDGRPRRAAPPAKKRVVSRRTARRMRSILTGVVERGTGVEAQIPGYEVAGKTGTAQKPLPNGGYGDSYISSFAGFVPARHPEIVVLVTFDEPSPIWGGSTAAPTFRTLAEFAVRHFGISPTGNAVRAARELKREDRSEREFHD